MQLGLRPAVAALAFVLTASFACRSARADGDVTTRGSMEVAGYRDSLAVSVLTPSAGVSVESPTAGWGANGRYLVDVVTAASPDIVSTASPRWTEIRHAGGVGGKYKPGDTGVAASGSASYTPDYLALGASGQITQDLDEKNLTLLAGYAFGHDTIGRTGTPLSVFSRTLEYHALTAGVTRVLTPRLVVGVTGDGILERGDQSKPYRYIPIFLPADAARVQPGASIDEVASLRIQARPLEQLPLDRERFALTGRLAWRFSATTLRLDQRGYADSWGLRASTTDVRYFVDLSRRFTMWPHVRFHAQNSVSFWRRAYAASGASDLPAIRAGDRELSQLFNLGVGGGLRIALRKSGSVDDLVLTTTVDGTWSSYADTVYLKTRWAGLVATGLEVVF